MDRPLSVVVGIGGSWGVGTDAYTDKLRMHPLDITLP
jgi:hypothetical protein